MRRPEFLEDADMSEFWVRFWWVFLSFFALAAILWVAWPVPVWIARHPRIFFAWLGALLSFPSLITGIVLFTFYIDHKLAQRRR